MVIATRCGFTATRESASGPFETRQSQLGMSVKRGRREASGERST